MSSKFSLNKKALDLVILLLLMGVAGYQAFSRFSRADSGRDYEDDLLLTGLDPRAESPRVPGRSLMGDANADLLGEAVSGRRDTLTDLELTGLIPESGTAPAVTPPAPANPAPVPPAAPIPAGQAPEDPSDSPAVLAESPPARPEPEPEPEPEPGPAPPEPESASAEGIWVRSSREGANPIRVEDHVSVDARQLAEMAGFRNISTDMRFPPPQFIISGVGSGRLGTYVIVDHQMIRLNGQISSPSQPPRAWRLVDATTSEVFWAPVE